MCNAPWRQPLARFSETKQDKKSYNGREKLVVLATGQVHEEGDE
jgi:hypothetical protein